MRTSADAWTPWSSSRAFRAGLVRLINPPTFYYATELGSASNARFAYEVTTDSSLEACILSSNGQIIWAFTAPGSPGQHELVWPGFIFASQTYPLPFPVVLAPRGRYTLAIDATSNAGPLFTERVIWEFLVAW